MDSLYSIAKDGYSHDPVTKPLRYCEIIEQAVREEDLAPKSILEIGVYKGESTKVFSRRFPDAHIVAVDLKLADIDFSGCENVRYLQCDQTDEARLRAICEEHFANGLDLVIEDASHIGHLSKLTFDIVFPHVRSGGLYIVEDWGSGYWETWPDGGRFTDCKVPGNTARIAKTIRSHDSGMVGFVKSLVDYTATGDIASDRAVARGWMSRLALSAARVDALRKLTERMPRLRAWLAAKLDKPVAAHAAVKVSAGSGLPQLKSLKFSRSLCIACKA
ncbi:MAG: class I SAM-dependent methyltransferase [Sulfuritalea sp.]|nr:class I SAM-dependent methyltransferase [Sulfuritalea sp.]